MAEATKLVRIKPTSVREVHVIFGRTFRKEKGWYKVPVALADALAVEPLNDATPDDGMKVFDVADESVAKVIANAETRKEDPRGTVDKPAVFDDEPTAAPTVQSIEAAAAAPAGQRRRRGAVTPAAAPEADEPPAADGEAIPGAPRRRRS